MTDTQEPTEASDLSVFAAYTVFLMNVILLIASGVIAGFAPIPAVILTAIAAVLGVVQFVIVVRESILRDTIAELLKFVSTGAMILGVGPLALGIPAFIGSL